DSTLGNVIVASTCKTVPRSPARSMSRSLVISGWKRRLLGPRRGAPPLRSSPTPSPCPRLGTADRLPRDTRLSAPPPPPPGPRRPPHRGLKPWRGGSPHGPLWLPVREGGAVICGRPPGISVRQSLCPWARWGGL